MVSLMSQPGGDQSVKTLGMTEDRFYSVMPEIVKGEESTALVLIPLPCHRSIRSRALKQDAAHRKFGQFDNKRMHLPNEIKFN